MKAIASLIYLFLVFTPFSVNAYIPDKAIAFSSEQLAVGKLLIATDNIQGSIFEKSVILLTHHDQAGDVGLIINKPSRYQVKEVYPGFVMADRAGLLYVGGPVMNAVLSALVKRKDDVEADGLKGVLPHIFHSFVSRSDAAEKYFSATVDDVRFYSGYAGWGKDQLLTEINRGGWYVIDADPAIVFDGNPDTMWQELLRKAQGK